MLRSMLKQKPKLTYANVAATIALVLSMSGGALAASHYLINSTKQINPRVLKALTGAQGPKGATGATGVAGATGREGAAGASGGEGKQGPQGAPGSALASAHITASGELDEANSTNFSGVTIANPAEEGVYCISGLPFQPHNVTATTDARESGGFAPGVSATVGPWGLCSKSASTQITVETWELGFEEVEFVNLGFYLSVN